MVSSISLVTLMLVAFNVALVSSAQLLLKMGSGKISAIVDKNHLLLSGLKIAFNPYLFSGTFCYVVSLVLWIYILTRSSLSMAYPLMSMSYVTVMVLSVLLIKEQVNLWQWMGAGMIVIGISMVYLFKY